VGREDLIGFDKKCLIKPRKIVGEYGLKKECKIARPKESAQKTKSKKTIRNVHKTKNFARGH